MFKQKHRDTACLLNILDSIQKIRRYASSYNVADELYNDSKSFDAVMMNFVIIGEMAGKLSAELREQTEDSINWFKIIGFRNIISHNYFGIDAEEVWQIIQNSLHDLELNINLILDQ